MRAVWRRPNSKYTYSRLLQQIAFFPLEQVETISLRPVLAIVCFKRTRASGVRT